MAEQSSKMDEWVAAVTESVRDAIEAGEVANDVYEVIDWLDTEYRADSPEDVFVEMMGRVTKNLGF